MIATLEYSSILDMSEELSNMILQSEVMKTYEDAHRTLQNNEEAQKLIMAFNDIKEHYEDVQRFGRYHPDYNEIMKAVRSTKRKMDMNEAVAKYKIAERDIQRLLDEVSGYIALSVSDQIKAPVDGAALTDHGCGSGGSCGCNVS